MAQVMRTAQKVDFGTPRDAGGVQDRTSYVNPDFAKYEGSKGRLKTATDVEVSSTDYLLSAIGAAAQQKGRQMFKDSAEDAWLTGQAAAAAGKSKDEVETNIFTRAWANEGWSDTKARLSLSDADVRFASDLPKLREQDPEKLQEYLQKRRDELLPLMDGMSLEARKGMVGQMALSDQHAIAKHRTEYSKFVVDQQAAAITTAYSVANKAMDAAKGDTEAYKTATANALGTLYSTVIMNPNLPEKNKQELLTQAAQLSLTGNHQQLYEQMRDFKDPQGRTMLEALPLDEQNKLAKQYQTSRAETSMMRNGKYMEQLGLYTSQLKAKDGELVSWPEHQRFVQEGVQLGVINGSKITELADMWGDSQRRKSIEGNVAQMLVAGDANGLFAAGVSRTQAWDSFINVNRKQGKSLAETTASATQVAVATGDTMGFTKVGEMMGPAIQAAFRTPDGRVDPAKLEGLNTVIKTIEQFDGTSNRGAKVAFLASFDEDTQNLVTNYMSNLRENGGVAGPAAAKALTTMTDTQAMSPAQRAAASNFKNAEVAKAVNELTPKGMFAQFKEWAMPDWARSKDAIAADKLRVAKNWGDDPDMVEAAAVPMRLAVLSAAERINRENPGMTSEGVITRALADVSKRSVQTEGGPLVIPEGQTIQSYFGVERSVDAEIVGVALSSMHKAAPGNRTFFIADSNGSMRWEERNASTREFVRGDVFNPKQVALAAQAEQAKRTRDFAETDGPGRTVTGSDGSSVRYNGENSVGIGTRVAVQIRNDLVKHEQVRNKPYPDGKNKDGTPKFSVGVGVNSGNPEFYPKVGPDGTVSQADIDRSFMGASNKAMRTANEYVQELPRERQGAPAIRLLTTLSYQGGSVKPEVRKALAGADKAAALAAIKATPQYQMAHKERKDYYEEMTNAVMNSNIINRN